PPHLPYTTLFRSSLLQTRHRKVDGFAVVGHQHGEAEHFAGPFAAAEFIGFEQVVDGDEIALGLAHLAALDLEVAVVHPDIGHHVSAVGAAGLGDFVFGVREDQIETAAVNVEGFAEERGAHRGAFDVPAGAAPAPRAVPAGLVLTGGFPE